jgi:ketosteroid isomerase-like protein
VTQQMSDHEPEQALDALYEAARSGDQAALGALIAEDAFVLTETADGGRRGRDEIARALIDAVHAGVRHAGSPQIKQRERSISVSASGRTAWAYERVDLVPSVGAAASAPSLRLTLLLTRAHGWRLAAGHWSTPISNAASHALIDEGKLPMAVVLPEDVGADAEPFVAAIGEALASPQSIPSLYSTGGDVRAIGSAVDEVFVGPQVKPAWEEFIGYGPRLAWRGGRVAALSEPDVGWLASHIDISFDRTTPYRFFYIWRREADEWRVVVSHDSLPTL